MTSRRNAAAQGQRDYDSGYLAGRRDGYLRAQHDLWPTVWTLAVDRVRDELLAALRGIDPPDFYPTDPDRAFARLSDDDPVAGDAGQESGPPDSDQPDDGLF